MFAVKLVKRQINGNEHLVLKEDANLEDLREEVSRLTEVFGYKVQPDGHAGRYIATHDHFSGKFALMLESD